MTDFKIIGKAMWATAIYLLIIAVLGAAGGIIASYVISHISSLSPPIANGIICIGSSLPLIALSYFIVGSTKFFQSLAVAISCSCLAFSFGFPLIVHYTFDFTLSPLVTGVLTAFYVVGVLHCLQSNNHIYQWVKQKCKLTDHMS
jgi:hypothetical protein